VRFEGLGAMSKAEAEAWIAGKLVELHLPSSRTFQKEAEFTGVLYAQFKSTQLMHKVVSKFTNRPLDGKLVTCKIDKPADERPTLLQHAPLGARIKQSIFKFVGLEAEEEEEDEVEEEDGESDEDKKKKRIRSSANLKNTKHLILARNDEHKHGKNIKASCTACSRLVRFVTV